MATNDAHIQAEAIVKAACLRAAADFVIARGAIAHDQEPEKAIPFYAMKMWGQLEKPANWPA